MSPQGHHHFLLSEQTVVQLFLLVIYLHFSLTPCHVITFLFHCLLDSLYLSNYGDRGWALTSDSYLSL